MCDGEIFIDMDMGLRKKDDSDGELVGLMMASLAALVHQLSAIE
jgi:hypothetical protein